VPSLYSHTLIALDHGPLSRISYLTTCHSRHNPAATGNWTLSGTLETHYRTATCHLWRPRRTASHLLPAWGGAHTLLISCYSFLAYGERYTPIVGSDQSPYRVSRPDDCPRGKVRLGSQRVCGWPERIIASILCIHGTMWWAFLHQRKVNVRSSLHHESARRNNLRLHAYT
jgi:hypothetical protein